MVAEVNPDALDRLPQGIVANPNCTTMTGMPPLAALDAAAGLRTLVIDTYQSVSGAGRDGTAELDEQVRKVADQAAGLALDGGAVEFLPPRNFVAPVAFNVLPFAGSLVDDGRLETDEEQKLAMRAGRSSASPTWWSRPPACVPVFTGHSWPSMRASSDRSTSRRPTECLPRRRAEFSGVPTPLQAAGADPVYVGRLRRDDTVPGWRSSARRTTSQGAALNAVQIAELLASR